MANRKTNNSKRKTNNRQDQQQERKQSPEITVDNVTFAVEHVRDWGRRGGISFALRVCAPVVVEIYNCRIMDSRNGGEFIAMPSRKGSDGNYYHHAYIQLTEQQQADIIQLVYDELEEA